MTESEYLRATNRVKVSSALTILRDVLPGDNWGISKNDLGIIIQLLRAQEEKLFESYVVKDESLSYI